MDVVKKLGGDYVSAGNGSRFLIPKRRWGRDLHYRGCRFTKSKKDRLTDGNCMEFSTKPFKLTAEFKSLRSVQ
jgi:hypothetical protein